MKKRASLRQSQSKFRGKKSRGDDSNVSMNLKIKHDEEISSDEDEDLPQPEEDDSDEDEEIVETAEEKRRRLAKGYLQQVADLVHAEGSDSDDDDEMDAQLTERLKRERLSNKGRFYREFGEHFEALNVEDVAQRHLYGHSGAITALALTSDETAVFTGSKNNSIIRWDTETGQKQELKRKWSRQEDRDQQSHEGEILALAVSSDGRYVAGGGKDCAIRVYDKRNKYAEVHVFKTHKEAVSGLTFQSGTYAMFSASFDRCIKHWDLNEMAYIETLFGHQDAVSAIDCWHKLRPLSVSNDRTVRRWKVEESSHLVYRGHKAPIDAVQILHDDTFVTGSEDGRISLWKDSKKNAVSTVTDSHGLDEGSTSPRWVTSLSAIKASDTFASGSNDGYVRIWSAKNDRLKQTAQIPVPGFVNALSLTSRLLVAGCGREHRLGRWWNMKKCKDRLTIMRFPHDLSELVDEGDDSQSSEESDSDDADDDESSSSYESS